MIRDFTPKSWFYYACDLNKHQTCIRSHYYLKNWIYFALIYAYSTVKSSSSIFVLRNQFSLMPFQICNCHKYSQSFSRFVFWRKKKSYQTVHNSKCTDFLCLSRINFLNNTIISKIKIMPENESMKYWF